MQMQLSQRQEQRQIVLMAVELAQFVASRHIELVEWGLVALGVNWIRTLADERAFDSTPSYDAMASLTRGWPWSHGNPQGPWITAIGGIVALFLLAYLLHGVSWWREGPQPEGEYTRLLLATYWLRLLGLAGLVGWNLFVATMLHEGNPAGSGWGAHVVCTALSSISLLLLAYRRGPLLLPDRLVAALQSRLTR